VMRHSLSYRRLRRARSGIKIIQKLPPTPTEKVEIEERITPEKTGSSCLTWTKIKSPGVTMQRAAQVVGIAPWTENNITVLCPTG
jgi:hypothetical protein